MAIAVGNPKKVNGKLRVQKTKGGVQGRDVGSGATQNPQEHNETLQGAKHKQTQSGKVVQNGRTNPQKAAKAPGKGLMDSIKKRLAK